MTDTLVTAVLCAIFFVGGFGVGMLCVRWMLQTTIERLVFISRMQELEARALADDRARLQRRVA